MSGIEAPADPAEHARNGGGRLGPPAVRRSQTRPVRRRRGGRGADRGRDRRRDLGRDQRRCGAHCQPAATSPSDDDVTVSVVPDPTAAAEPPATEPSQTNPATPATEAPAEGRRRAGSRPTVGRRSLADRPAARSHAHRVRRAVRRRAAGGGAVEPGRLGRHGALTRCQHLVATGIDGRRSRTRLRTATRNPHGVGVRGRRCSSAAIT